MLFTLQGCWTIALYFGLLGIIWLPRYYVIPPRLRLWPSYLLYNTLTNPFSTSSYSIPSIQSKRTYTSRNYTVDIEYKDLCFSCQLNVQPKYCGILMYSDILFDSIHTANSYDVYTYETYPCYQTLSKSGKCVLDDNTNPTFSGTGCTLCSLCHKNTIFNTSHISKYRKFSYTPRYSIKIDSNTPDSKHVLHCLNKLVLVKYFTTEQFCKDLRDHISVHKYDKITVFTGCKSFCSDCINIVFKELYSTEIGVYLIMLAVVVILLLCVVYCMKYVVSLYLELGILKLPWNSTATCPICMDKLYRLTRISTLHCGHMFCRSCLHQWLHIFGHVTCPLCRQPVDPNVPYYPVVDNVPPPLLMLSDHSTEGEGDMSERSSPDHTSAPRYNIIQSIYNMGLNVVSTWAHHHTNQTLSARSTDPNNTDALVSELFEPTPQTSANSHVISDTVVSTAAIHVTSTNAIPMPYYPLYDVSDRSTSSVYNSVIVPYRSPMFFNGTTTVTSSYNSYNLSTTVSAGTTTATVGSSSSINHCTPLFTTHSAHPTLYNSLDMSYSDSEAGVSSLQDRIARKINRNREKRMRLRGDTRRAHSTSDLTSVTSDVTSESEMDVL